VRRKGVLYDVDRKVDSDAQLSFQHPAHVQASRSVTTSSSRATHAASSTHWRSDPLKATDNAKVESLTVQPRR
jgi:hypothetical protein